MLDQPNLNKFIESIESNAIDNHEMVCQTLHTCKDLVIR